MEPFPYKDSYSHTQLDMFDQSVFDKVYKDNQRFEQNGKYYDKVRETLTGKYVEIETLFDIGVDIGSDICEESAATKTRILEFLNAMAAIHRLSYEVVGDAPGSKSVMAIRDYMRLAIVSQLPRTSATEAMFKAIKSTLEIDTHNEQLNDNNSWHLSNLEFLESKFDAYKKMSDIANKYNSNETLEASTYENLKTKAGLLTQEAMRHRKYGTKPAYIDASIGGAWIFYDADDWHNKMGHNVRDEYAHRFQNIAAVVCYSPYEEFKSLNFSVKYDKFGDPIVQNGGALDKIELTLFIDQSGRISFDIDGVADLGLELGMSLVQELALKAEISSNFYDLSMPVMRHRSNDKTFENPIDRKKAGFNPIQDLLIPRIKYLDQPEDFPASDDVTRTIRKHDVTWFVRTLPPGWLPSPEAVAEAEAHGIELSENETFVKSHTRGSHNKVLGYHAVKRSNSK